MADRGSLRLAFVVCLGVIVSMSVGDVEELGPQELGDGSELGQAPTAKIPSVPLNVVSSFTKKLEAENKHLAIENTALRAQSEVDEGKLAAQVVADGGYPKQRPQDAEEEQAAKDAPPPDSEMDKQTRKGLKVVNKYAKQVRDLQLKLQKETEEANAVKEADVEKSLQQKEALLAAQQEKMVAHDYSIIPFFKFTAGGKELPDIKSQGECQQVCDRQLKCMSYSWSTALTQCLWSVDTIHYDHLYIFSVKAQVATPGNPGAMWREFPGVKYITAHSHNKENMEFAACKQQCADDTECKSFSYRQDTKFCSWSSNGMAYDAQFSYFEKEQASPSKKAEMKKAKLKEAEEALKNKIIQEQEKEKKTMEEEQRENDQKKWEKNLWLKATPSTSDEAHMKQTVKEQMAVMDAKFAGQAAEKKEEAEKKAEDDLEKAELAVVTKVTKKEADLRKIDVDKKTETDKLGPLEQAAATAKVEVAKVEAKIKIADVDIRMKERAVEAASDALKQAQKSGNPDSLATSQTAYGTAKKAVVEEEDKKSKFLVLLDEKKTDYAKESDLHSTAVTKEKEFKTEAKGKETAVKDEIKAEKKALAEQKHAMLVEKEKAFSAKVAAAKANEKIAKSKRADAKVNLMKDEDELKKVSTDKQRLDVEQQESQHKGDLFKADEENENYTRELIETAKVLSATKETLHKAAKTVAKAKDSDKRENVDNKLQKLENEEVKSPV